MLYQQSTRIGEVGLRSLQFPDDIHVLHQWMTQPYAKYWGMTEANFEQVHQQYVTLDNDPHQQILIGMVQGSVAFLLEVYDPAFHELKNHYQLECGDIGMHLLLAPAVTPIRHFSYEVMAFVIEFLLIEQQAKRVVVEPDASNDKIHQLNKRVGFVHQKPLLLQEQDHHKQALLGFCDRASFEAAKQVHSKRYHQITADFALQPAEAAKQLDQQRWQVINRHLVKKALAEFSHERLLKPELVATQGPWHSYALASDNQQSRYFFDAQVLALDHWSIKASSIRHQRDGKPAPLDILNFIVDFSQSIGLKQPMLATYLEEVSGTLLSGAYKLSRDVATAAQLVDADFQQYEFTMSEGHPSFIANNGRMGFGVDDYHAYAPEVGAPIQLLWLAAHKDKVSYAHCPGWSYEQLIQSELDLSLRQQFEAILQAQDRSSRDYRLIPVHPWQWHNKLVHVFAAEIAAGRLICLGYGDDSYQAQQSIRTFYNLNHENKHYVKTALSILNMGFVRGLSTYYMKTTPAINQWVYDLVARDGYLQNCGFTILRELAATGYNLDLYDNDVVGDTPYKKMLAALWRENPSKLLRPGQKLMTMAALLHVDDDGNALLPELIARSGMSVSAWLELYFNAYLTPLLHCFYRYKLVFMPHGENLILVLQNHIPVKAIMKDIGEEICLLNSEMVLPQEVERIKVTVPVAEEVLAIFTDVFDCFFRYLSAILYEQMGYPAEQFWQLVAECVYRYQDRFPALAPRFAEHDLFAEDFALSCLNRLQLGNPKHMLDLADPSAALQFAGQLKNPLHAYRRETEQQVALA